jgi:DNA-binding NarL/FixJ family response regulator
MHFLLIEDDPNKANQIHTFLTDEFPDASIEVRKSYQSGVKALLDKSAIYDLVLLDMSLPTFDRSPNEDGYLHKQLGGEEILRELKRKKQTHKVIVVTQFDFFGHGASAVSLESLKKKLRIAFSTNYLDTVYYNAGESKWKEHLKLLVHKCIRND